METRDEKLSTTVTAGEKQSFREIAAKDGMNMSEKLRSLVYDELERRDHETKRSKEKSEDATTADDVLNAEEVRDAVKEGGTGMSRDVSGHKKDNNGKK